MKIVEICPVCGKEMIRCHNEYDVEYVCYSYDCATLKFADGTYYIPVKYRPTNKQMVEIADIADELKMDFDPLTKVEADTIIKDYKDIAKYVKKERLKKNGRQV